MYKGKPDIIGDGSYSVVYAGITSFEYRDEATLVAIKQQGQELPQSLVYGRSLAYEAFILALLHGNCLF